MTAKQYDYILFALFIAIPTLFMWNYTRHTDRLIKDYAIIQYNDCIRFQSFEHCKPLLDY